MFKSILLCGALCLSTLSAAYAQQATGARCDDESMKYIKSQVDMGADKLSASDKAMIMSEMEAAQTAQQAKQVDACAQHMGNIIRTMNIDRSMMPKG